ncbi:hypothetical protein SDC9_21107 [bioreactor metagenome]|uniref:Immunity MXAN-0049 protein domain-containing protein n=1 Tax=bioreactor metagenome TaxID=1076179 RepID=A0A644U8V5_9ZZZZ|nr:DUF1629 domain-containing protein [Desulfitobacterium hafniense]MEA5023431.1 hypothetical protein [Desulfitobacterium hafniense]
MKVWLWKPDSNKYENLTLPLEDVDKLIDFYEFDGRKISDVWEPMEVGIYKKAKRGDTPSFIAGPVLSERAVETLRDILDDKVEILPLKYSKENYYVINVLNVLDAIDYTKAEYLTFDDGRVYRFTKYAFIEEKVKSQPIFKLVEHPKSEVFVSDEFRSRVLEHKLAGFEFIEVWDSEVSTEPIAPEAGEKAPGKSQTELEPIIPAASEAVQPNVEYVYPELTDQEAEALLVKIKSNVYSAAIQFIREASQQGAIDEVGLEYFFDGTSTDIGLRVIAVSNNEEYDFEELRFQLLQHPDIEYDFNHLYRHYGQNGLNEEQTDAFWIMIQDIVAEVQEKLKGTSWESLVPVTDEFRLNEPEVYD